MRATLLARLLLLVGLALLPALGLQVHAELSAGRERERLVHEDALRLACLVAAEQERVIEGARQLVTALGKAPPLLAGDFEACREYLSDLLREFPRYANITATDREGRITCSVLADGPGRSLADRAYFRDAMRTGGFVVGEHIVGRASGRSSISFAQPYLGRDGLVAGVVLAGLDLDWLAAQLDRVPLPPGASATILDRNGTFLARQPAIPGLVGTRMPERWWRYLPQLRAGTSVALGLDGVDRIVGYVPLAEEASGMFVTVGLDAARAFAAVEQARRAGLGLIAAGTLLAFALIWLGARRLVVRPTAALLAAASQWRMGDLSARVDPQVMRTGSSEFARLADAFNAMAGSLAEREAALRASEGRFRRAVAAAGIGTWDWDAATNRLVNSPDFEGLYGRGPGEMGNREAFLSAVHTGDRAMVAEAIARTAGGAAGSAFEIEYRVPLPGGGERWLRSQGAVTSRGAGGVARGMSGVVSDVTARKEAENALARSEARYRVLTEAASHMTWLMRPDGTFIYASQRWRAYTGITKEEVTEQDWVVLLHPEDRDRMLAEIGGPFGRGEPHEARFRLQRHDGVHRWVLARAEPLRDPAGRVVEWVGTTVDIHDMLEAQATQAESEARLKLAVEGAGAGVWELDVRRGAWRLDRCAVALTGAQVSADAWVPDNSPEAQAWFAAIHPDDVPLRDAAHAAIRSGASERYDVEYRVPRGDGSWRWLAQQALVVERDARTHAPVRLVGVARDVTGRRDLQAELERQVAERTAELRESEARLAQAGKMEALGRLAGGVAHDFNNVLQAVQGGIALATKRVGRDPDGALRFLELAADATDRGAAVTGRLLSFARRGELTVAPVEPRPMLDGLAQMLRHTLGPGVAVTVEAEAACPRLLADAGQLEAVLVNLANNARDALPGGEGRVALGAGQAAPAPCHLPPGRYVRLTVRDDGTGMTPDVLARVTEPFFTTKPKGRGTGLGLAMARGFAEQSGGALAIESAPGQGTTVSLWLPEAGPLQERDLFGPEAPPRDIRHVPAKSLLVVDDEDAVRTVLTAGLAERGHAVSEAGGGAAALARLDAGATVDVLVTDLAMPGGMDGLALLREARLRRPGLPAVLVTGHVGDATRSALEEAARGGPFAVLRKPVTAEAVEAQVALLLQPAAA